MIKVDAPFFIIGNPRSGTSLFRLMLSAHSKITVPPESGFLLWWHDKYKDWSVTDSKNSNRIDEYINDLAISKKIETWNLNYPQIKKLISDVLPTDYSSLSSLIYCSYGLLHNKSVQLWGDKNNYYLKHIDSILKIFPQAYFIHVVRDGRDVACSYIDIADLKTDSPYKPILPTEIDEIARRWKSNNILIENALEGVLENKKIVIKYEDIILDTERVLRQVCDFLNMEFDSNMLRYYEFEQEPEKTIDWKKKTLEKPDANNIDRYINVLSAEKITCFNEIAKDLLIKYGYRI